MKSLQKIRSKESKERKPEFLYHGSPNRNIDVFKLQISYGSGEKYGAKVYATPDKAISTIFLSDVKKPWTAGKYGDVLVSVIPYSRKKFIAHDKGGIIYVLPGDTFEHNENEMGGGEWASAVGPRRWA